MRIASKVITHKNIPETRPHPAPMHLLGSFGNEPASGIQTGLMKLLNVTGVASLMIAMSLVIVARLYCGWTTTAFAPAMISCDSLNRLSWFPKYSLKLVLITPSLKNMYKFFHVRWSILVCYNLLLLSLYTMSCCDCNVRWCATAGVDQCSPAGCQHVRRVFGC